jgi:hypothetical protein
LKRLNPFGTPYSVPIRRTVALMFVELPATQPMRPAKVLLRNVLFGTELSVLKW